jgi:hypothetical protein
MRTPANAPPEAGKQGLLDGMGKRDVHNIISLSSESQEPRSLTAAHAPSTKLRAMAGQVGGPRSTQTKRLQQGRKEREQR